MVKGGLPNPLSAKGLATRLASAGFRQHTFEAQAILMVEKLTPGKP